MENSFEKHESLVQCKKELNLKDALLIKCGDIQTATWVNLKCRYGCEGFGKRYTCPPYSPHPFLSIAILSEYKNAILIHDEASWKVRWAVREIEKKAVAMGYMKAFGLGSGPCGLCKDCLPKLNCSRPEEARPSMEAIGIDVFSTVRKFGFHLKSDPASPKFFGLVLIE